MGKTCSEALLDEPADDVVLPASAAEDHMPLAHGVGPHARRLYLVNMDSAELNA